MTSWLTILMHRCPNKIGYRYLVVLSLFYHSSHVLLLLCFMFLVCSLCVLRYCVVLYVILMCICRILIMITYLLTNVYATGTLQNTWWWKWRWNNVYIILGICWTHICLTETVAHSHGIVIVLFLGAGYLGNFRQVWFYGPLMLLQFLLSHPFSIS